MPFTNCTSQTNKTEVDNVSDLDIVMSMYSLIEYSKNYTKISISLWQHHKDGSSNSIKNSVSFTFKAKITENRPADVYTKDSRRTKIH